jgi:ABC-type nitrate/sulfonate/bicarbonate transport system substrate-binding protein
VHPNLSGKTIRVIYNGTPSIATVLETHAEQLLRTWRADVQVTYGGTAQVVYGAMVTNQADVMEFSPQGGITAVASGIPVKDFAVTGPRMDYAFISKPSIKTLKDLKGAKIGVLDTVGLNGVQESLVLKAAGLTSKDVTTIQAGGQGNRVAALLSGRVDATMVGFVNYLTLQKQGYNLLYSYTKEQPKLIDGVFWATGDWLKAHHTEAVAINQALLQSARFFNDTKNKQAFVDEATTLVKGTNPTDVAQMYDIYKQNDFFQPNYVVSAEVMQFNQDLYYQYKSIDKEFPVTQLVDTGPSQEALTKEGKV